MENNIVSQNLSRIEIGVGELFLIYFKLFFISFITLNFALPFCINKACSKIIDNIYIEGRKLIFIGKAKDLYPKFFLSMFLSFITLGIYLIWFIKNLYKWIAENTIFEDEVDSEIKSEFSITALDVLIMEYFYSCAVIFTFGIAFPWLLKRRIRWIINNVSINGQRLNFDCSENSIVKKYFIWLLLAIVTFGIYGIWIENKILKWSVSNSKISKTNELDRKQQKSDFRYVTIFGVVATFTYLCFCFVIIILNFDQLFIILEDTDLYYQFDDQNNLYVTGLKDTTQIEIVIPDTYSGYDVYGVSAMAFKNNSSITSITIEDGIEVIGYQAFQGCTGLTELVIPDSVTTIGFGIMEDCDNLEKITVPFIGIRDVSPSNKYFGYFFGATEYLNNSTYVPTSLNEVAITKATSIASYTFYGCTGLTDITLNDDLQYIYANAFQNCSGLSQMVIPDSVILMGYKMFYGCTSLKNLTIPFIGYSNTIGESSPFSHLIEYETTIKTLQITQAVMLCDYAFDYYRSLETIILPETLTSIGEHSFQDCISLKSIILPSKITEIPDGAFYDCISLEYIVIPNITIIDLNAFTYCNNLETIYYTKNSVVNWANISKPGLHTELSAATLYLYSPSQPSSGNYWHYLDGVPTKW